MFAPILLLASLAGMISAQDSSDNYTSVYTVDPSTVSSADKSSWCTAQQNSCLQICDNQAYPNRCSNTDLSWECVCSSVKTPNISSYEQTVPYFECRQYIANCQVDTTDAATQRACLAIDCAPNDPSTMLAYYASSASAAASSSAAAAASSTAATTTSSSGSTTGTSASATAAATTNAALAWSNVYGNSVLGAGAVALFGFAL